MEFSGHEESGVFILDTPTKINVDDFALAHPHSMLILSDDYNLDCDSSILYGYTLTRGFNSHCIEVIKTINKDKKRCKGFNLGVGAKRYEMCN